MLYSKITSGFLCSLVFFMSLTVEVRASDENCQYGFASVHLDQDLFLEIFPLVDSFPKAFVENEDRDYTMGLAVSAYTCPNSGLFLPQQALSDVLFETDGRNKSYITTLGYNAYTPDQLNTSDPIFDDRPYASILYLTNNFILSAEDNNSSVETSLTIGFLGLGIGKTVQTWIHQKNRENTGLETPYDPLGWHNQIADGGQPTAMLSIANYQRLTPKLLSQNRYVDVVVSGEAQLGYSTNLSAGLMGRFGWFRQNLPVENVIRQGGYQYSSIKENSSYGEKWELYGFAGIRLHAVAYNALLQGQFGENVHTLSASQVKNFIYDYTIGAGLTYKKARLQLYCSTRSSEHYLTTQRSHSWCGTNFSYGF